MPAINKKRMFAQMDSGFVIFMIGMRINSFWRIWKWFPITLQMPRMLKELYKNPEMGFLGQQSWFGRTTIMVQYWKSLEHLELYAKNKNANHFPAWKNFNLKVRQSGHVGIWHETYIIHPGEYENVYVNMPKFGLGNAGKLLSVTEKYDAAHARMKSTS
jgi:hypothetical protein